jgi:hypothetical protein
MKIKKASSSVGRRVIMPVVKAGVDVKARLAGLTLQFQRFCCGAAPYVSNVDDTASGSGDL